MEFQHGVSCDGLNPKQRYCPEPCVGLSEGLSGGVAGADGSHGVCRRREGVGTAEDNGGYDE